ncbi:hypothetical protein MKX01_009755 [Papaver californicum]|nr:hypothetical protein MKX01_009755 [Papaver californicum]
MEDYSLPKDSLFLGFDIKCLNLIICWSCKATILDSNLNIVTSDAVHFDSELPHYKTKDGVHRDPSGDGRIVSPTLMWIEALELLLEKLKKSGLDFGRIVAVSGSGQQHGSVYWKKGSLAKLWNLDASKSLKGQLSDAFSTKESPVWMDSSTTAQCREIENAVGGASELSRLTGSRGYERFTGPQIRKIFQTQPDVYADTERISLVSSFMACLLTGSYASIDETDGAGMNLMDIKERVWSKIVLEATAPGLEEKLGNLAPAHAVAGLVAPYFVKKFHFDKNCIVVQWSGDNPNSLADIRNKYAEQSWDTFNNYLEKTSPLNDSASLGAALRAAHGWLCNKKSKFVPISCMYENKLEKTALSCKLLMPAGDPQLLPKYTLLMKKRTEIEDRLIQKLGRQ